ncbi:hypothetical protein [Atopobium sp. oral taxon 810]|nr:hypothetical protein [Atopobium sp. oral taxon 810]ERI03963.1 hypothetical protein HMPREF9069_01727 [Atopobium sp. oral taxon 810 str. F0209]
MISFPAAIAAALKVSNSLLPTEKDSRFIERENWDLFGLGSQRTES